VRFSLKWKLYRFPLFFAPKLFAVLSSKGKKVMSQELVRIVDNIAHDKNIDRESIFVDLEEAMVSAVRKHFGEPDSEIVVRIDRTTGEVTAFKDNEQIDIRQLGRIPAQTAKQVMIQKIKADERPDTPPWRENSVLDS
jgi:hypothetical protein